MEWDKEKELLLSSRLSSYLEKKREKSRFAFVALSSVVVVKAVKVALERP